MRRILGPSFRESIVWVLVERVVAVVAEGAEVVSALDSK